MNSEISLQRKQSRRSATLTGAAILALLLALPARAAAPAGFAELVEKTMPAVVHIITNITVEGADSPGFEEFERWLPEEFLERFRPPEGEDAPSRRHRSTGSGFVIDPAGYIVTNHHVVVEANEIGVRLESGDTLDATIVGSDSKTDIALLKVDPPQPLEFIRFGDSDETRVGDWVVAIGSPFGLGGSVSAGIISARNRDIADGPYDDYLQTDAAVNRGNSGGPLLNLGGEVVGVNSAIISPSGVSAGIAFAVPANLASHVVGQLREHGRTRRGWLGVKIQNVSEEIAESLGLEETAGAMVLSVNEDGPAIDAGIEAGDIILEFDGTPVEAMRELPRLVAETPVGKLVRLKVWRGDRTRTLTVEIGLLAEEGREVELSEKQPDRVADSLDMELAELDDRARDLYGYDSSVSGVLVVGVKSDSAAQRQGLDRGHVIVEVNRTPVSTPEEVRDSVANAAKSGRRSVLLLVNTFGTPRFVGIRLES